MLKGKTVGCSGGSGGGNTCAADSAEAVVGAERPRKKLSFREPEIMGYNVQMKQGTPTSSAKRNKVATPVTMPSTAVISGTSAPARSKNCLEDVSGSFEDLDLEVGHDVRCECVNICVLWPSWSRV
jgi:hypothetical protein